MCYNQTATITHLCVLVRTWFLTSPMHICRHYSRKSATTTFQISSVGCSQSTENVYLCFVIYSLEINSLVESKEKPELETSTLGCTPGVIYWRKIPILRWNDRYSWRTTTFLVKHIFSSLHRKKKCGDSLTVRFFFSRVYGCTRNEEGGAGVERNGMSNTTIAECKSEGSVFMER